MATTHVLVPRCLSAVGTTGLLQSCIPHVVLAPATSALGAGVRHLATGPPRSQPEQATNNSPQPRGSLPQPDQQVPSDTPSTETEDRSFRRRVLNLFTGFTSSKATAPPQQQPQQAAQTQAAAGTDLDKEAAKQRKEDLEQLQQLAMLDIDGLATFCSQVLSQGEPPVQLPTVPMWHVDYSLFVDYPRLEYLRTRQHLHICRSMTQEQKEEVEGRGEPVLRDLALIQAITATVCTKGQPYMELEIKDCLSKLFEYRRQGAAYLRWMTELGQGMPDSNEDRREATEAVQQMEALEWLAGRLAMQQAQAAQCMLRQRQGWVDPATQCPTTQLPFHHCCGGAPVPLRIAECYLDAEREGLACDSREFQKRLEQVSRVHTFSRLRGNHRAPRPLNHLLPYPEGSRRRMESHLKDQRRQQRREVQPKYDKTLQEARENRAGLHQY